jgi:hypothetical protein
VAAALPTVTAEPVLRVIRLHRYHRAWQLQLFYLFPQGSGAILFNTGECCYLTVSVLQARMGLAYNEVPH